MKGELNRAEAHPSEGGLIPLYHFNVRMATAQFRFDTPQFAAGSFILLIFFPYSIIDLQSFFKQGEYRERPLILLL